MGNAGSAKETKPQKDRKREVGGSVDDRTGNNKKRQNGKATDVRNSNNLGKEAARHRTTNPFLIFFLRLRSKKPKEHVTVIARAAGKLWTRMTPEQRKKYIDLANAEKKRREQQIRKRKSALTK